MYLRMLMFSPFMRAYLLDLLDLKPIVEKLCRIHWYV